MRPPSSSSKNPKKNSDEDRNRKKKIKSKSAKRRRDSSISSSSSELDSRSRRNRSKSKKIEKRRRESKKSDKKRSRKKRYRRDSSSVSGESWSDSERSRSPVRKLKSKKRDRKSSRYEYSRSGRYRSPSCSTCSGGRSRSRSRSRGPVAIEERFGGRSRSHSPIAFEERFGGRSRSRSPVPIEEERVWSSRGRSPTEERYGEAEKRKVKSVLAMTKASDEDGDKIIKAYDDYPSSRSNKSLEVGNEKRNLEVEIKEKGSYDKRIGDEVILSKDGKRSIKDSDGTAEGYSMRKEREVVVEDGGNEAGELELILRQKALENFRKFRGGRPAIKESLNDKKDETSKFESYQGSQNFVKQSESHPSSTDDQRHVQRGLNPNKSKPRTVANVPTRGNDGNTTCSLSNDTGGLGPVASSISSQKAPNQSKPIPNQPKARYVANVPTEEDDRNAVRGLSNDTEGSKPVASSITSQKPQNPLKREQESSKKMLAEETSLAKYNQNLKGVTEMGSGKASKAEVGTADMPVPGALNTENQNSKSNEPVTASASGSQFEEKTFSRMRDGEVVQVSYKVYIPKKTPALARRQLQR